MTETESECLSNQRKGALHLFTAAQAKSERRLCRREACADFRMAKPLSVVYILYNHRAGKRPIWPWGNELRPENMELNFQCDKKKKKTRAVPIKMTSVSLLQPLPHAQ